MNDIKTGVCALMAKQVAEEKKFLNKRRLKNRVLASKKVTSAAAAAKLTVRHSSKNNCKLNKINEQNEEASHQNGKKRLCPL
jgi:hypothetical protein